MSKLVEELKSEHAFIVSKLEVAKSKGVKEGADALISAKKALLAHLGKEDQKLYPALREAASKDSNLKALLDTFATDMDVVSTNALAFFDKCEKGRTTGVEFAKDFGNLMARLRIRISSEEGVLYSEYEKLNLD